MAKSRGVTVLDTTGLADAEMVVTNFAMSKFVKGATVGAMFGCLLMRYQYFEVNKTRSLASRLRIGRRYLVSRRKRRLLAMGPG
jgi:hypothetical protein